MNKYLIFVGAILFLSCTKVTAQEASVQDPIVNLNEIVDFGIWRVYNGGGGRIRIVDREEGNSLVPNPDWDSNGYRFAFLSIDDPILLFSDGTAGRSRTPFLFLSSHVITEPIENLQDGLYGSGSIRFLVNEDTMTIFSVDDETASGEISPATILKKHTNGLTYIGTATSTIIDPTTVLDANDIAGPAAILGDCLASYFGPTEIIIPCLSVEGDNTVYRVKLKQQTPNALIFDVDLGEVSRVQ